MMTTWSKFVPKQQAFKDQKPKKAKNVVSWQLEKEQLRNDFITTVQLMQSNVENGGSKTNDIEPISVSGWVSKLQLFHHPLY